ncbi:MAG: TerC family protein, partial [Planctomycetia bacterium]|nr:TerC family protein [Planctomycetia bacterium]
MSGDIIALVTLTLMEIVLGIDNIIFLAIVAGRVPKEQQARARRVGLVVALGTRLALLGVLFKLTELSGVIVFRLSGLGLPA